MWLWGLVYACAFNEPTRSLYPAGKRPIKSAINSCLSQVDLQVSSKTLCVLRSLFVCVCVFIWGYAVRQFPSNTITICLGAQYHNYSPQSPFFSQSLITPCNFPHKSCIAMIYGYYSLRLSYMWPCTPHPRAVNCLIMEIRWMAWAELAMINSMALCHFFWAVRFSIKVALARLSNCALIAGNHQRSSSSCCYWWCFFFSFFIFCLCPLTFNGRPRINMKRDLSHASFSCDHFMNYGEAWWW